MTPHVKTPMYGDNSPTCSSLLKEFVESTKLFSGNYELTLPAGQSGGHF